MEATGCMRHSAPMVLGNYGVPGISRGIRVRQLSSRYGWVARSIPAGEGVALTWGRSSGSGPSLTQYRFNRFHCSIQVNSLRIVLLPIVLLQWLVIRHDSVSHVPLLKQGESVR